MRVGNIDRERHEDLLPTQVAAKTTALIVGCGAIGSWTAVMLAKMGVRKFRLVDFDRVEDVNIPVQAFGVRALGMPKVDALREMLMRDCELEAEEVEAINGEFDEELAEERDVTVAAMDNLAGRQAVWEAMQGKTKLFVDPRMASQYLEVYAVETGDEKAVRHYGKIIYPSDEKFAEEPCAARAIAYTAGMAGAMVANVIRQWIMKEPERIKVMYFDIVRGDATVFDPAKERGEEEAKVGGEAAAAGGGLTEAAPQVLETAPGGAAPR